MQLILDEVHAMQREWAMHEEEDFASAAIINSSKVVGVTVSGTRALYRKAADSRERRMGCGK